MEGISFSFLPFNWSGVSGVSDILMTLLTLVLLLSLRQGAHSIRETALSRHAELLRWAMEEMEKVKPDINTLRSIYPEQNTLANQGQWQRSAQKVSVTLQRLSYMAEHKLIPKKHFREMWGPTVLECWYLLENCTKDKRVSNGEPAELVKGAYSRKDFESYALYCEQELPTPLTNRLAELYKALTPIVDSPLNHDRLL